MVEEVRQQLGEAITALTNESELAMVGLELKRKQNRLDPLTHDDPLASCGSAITMPGSASGFANDGFKRHT